jgi:hypothetical protein
MTGQVRFRATTLGQIASAQLFIFLSLFSLLRYLYERLNRRSLITVSRVPCDSHSSRLRTVGFSRRSLLLPNI